MEFTAFFWITSILLFEAVIMAAILGSRSDLVVTATMFGIFAASNIAFFFYGVYVSKYIKMRRNLRLYLARNPNEKNPDFASLNVKDITEHELTMKAHK